MPLPGSLLRRAPACLGGNIKIYREKVLLYGKLKKNIQTFKNVTMAKYIRAQDRTKNRDCSVGVTAKLFAHTPAFNPPIKPDTKLLMLNITTNRGTCGALNSRQAQNMTQMAAAGYNVKSLVVGKKGSDSFAALLPDNLTSGVIFDTDYTATNASVIAQMLFENHSYDICRINFTRYVSVAKQDWAFLSIPSFELFKSVVAASSNTGDAPKGAVNNARLLNSLIGCDEEVLRDFWEFHVQTAINFAMEENNLSELAARIVAVENQLQNISKLRDWAQNMYNKTRQASVTAELLELTSAAAAMEGMVEKKKKKNPNVLSEDVRATWVERIESAVRDIRFRLGLANGAAAGSAHAMSAEDTAMALKRLDKYQKWRTLVQADEKHPPEGIDSDMLRQFLSDLPQLWEAESFEIKLENLRRNPVQGIAGNVVGAFVAPIAAKAV